MNLMLEKYPDGSPVFLPSLLASRKFQGRRSEDSLSLEGGGISPPHSSTLGPGWGLQGPRSGGNGDRGPQALRLRLATSHASLLDCGPCPLLPVKSMGSG